MSCAQCHHFDIDTCPEECSLCDEICKATGNDQYECESCIETIVCTEVSNDVHRQLTVCEYRNCSMCDNKICKSCIVEDSEISIYKYICKSCVGRHMMDNREPSDIDSDEWCCERCEYEGHSDSCNCDKCLHYKGEGCQCEEYCGHTFCDLHPTYGGKYDADTLCHLLGKEIDDKESGEESDDESDEESDDEESDEESDEEKPVEKLPWRMRFN